MNISKNGKKNCKYVILYLGGNDMSEKRRKRKLKVGRVIVAIIIGLILIATVLASIFFIIKKGSTLVINKKDMYLASSGGNSVTMWRSFC